MSDYNLRYKYVYMRLLSAYPLEERVPRILDTVIGRTETWLNTENILLGNQKPKDVPFEEFKVVADTLPFPNKGSIEEYDLYPHWVEKN